tara:strand:+ start:140 stop:679 length:540 start_codon:yes stop_codon:yes gene_type:complete
LVITFSKSLVGEELDSKIITYIQGLSSFSSNFIQSSEAGLEQGSIYIKNDILRLDYNNPDRTLKISKEKGVYINHELREEEFFSTKKNIVKIFYDIFLKKNFFSSMPSKASKKEIVFSKTIQSEETKINLKIFFENQPLLLRKIVSKTENDLVSISFYDHNYNSIFEDNFFSFVPIYLD